MNFAVLGGIFLAVFLPDAIGLALFSAIGIAPTIYNAVASSTMNLAGNLVAAMCAAYLGFIFIIDFHLRSVALQIVLGLLLVVLFFGAAILKAIAYPWVPGLLCLCFTVVIMGWMRASFFNRVKVKGNVFFGAASMSFFICSFLVTAVWCGWLFGSNRMWSEETKIWITGENNKVYDYVWKEGELVYTTHCSNSADISSYTPKVQRQITVACGKAANVWFLQWSGPFVVLFCNALAGAFCVIFARTSPKLDTEVASADAAGDAAAQAASKDENKRHIKRVLKGCTLTIVLMLGFMYASASYVSGSAVKLSSAMFCLGAATVAATLGWMYLEIDHSLLKTMADESTMAANILKALRNNWFRAITIGGLNIFIPLMCILDMVRQKQRKMTGRASADDPDKFTPGGRKVFNELASWNWTSILSKVNIIGEMMVLLLVGMKVTFVFFSWLNEVLVASNMSFWVLSALVLVIGLAMFMCPIVPGSAVYLFAGVVLGALSQEGDGPGFWPGVGVAVVVSSIAKHVACTGQYLLGYAVGKSVKVQKFVGVDKVPTRAMEKILKTRGMGLGKVCILVAGPDFPTSVLCGILKLNIPQMLLGTSPVIVVSIIPQVLVGALLMLQTNQSGIWSMVSNAVTGVAAAIQAAATLIFSHRIMKTIEEDGEELARHRDEHEAVAELTRQEAVYNAAFQEISQWQVMRFPQKATLLSSAVGFIMAGFVMLADFMVSDKFCFRRFSITDRIGDSYELGGLNGNAFNLVIMPAGVGALFLSTLCFVLHMVFNRQMAKATQEHVRFQVPIKADKTEPCDMCGTELVTI